MDGKHFSGSRTLLANDGYKYYITAKYLLSCLFSSYDGVLQRPVKPLFFDISHIPFCSWFYWLF